MERKFSGNGDGGNNDDNNKDNEIARIFREEVAEKKRAGRGVFRKTGKRGYVGTMRMPSSKEEQKAGPVESYNINKIIDFVNNSDVLKALILERLDLEHFNYKKALSDSFDGIVDIVRIALGVIMDEIIALNLDLEELREEINDEKEVNVAKSRGNFEVYHAEEEEKRKKYESMDNGDSRGNTDSINHGNNNANEEEEKSEETVDKEENNKKKDETIVVDLDTINKEMGSKSKQFLTKELKKVYFFEKLREMEAAGYALTIGVARKLIPKLEYYIYASTPSNLWVNFAECTKEYYEYRNKEGFWKNIQVIRSEEE